MFLYSSELVLPGLCPANEFAATRAQSPYGLRQSARTGAVVAAVSTALNKPTLTNPELLPIFGTA